MVGGQAAVAAVFTKHRQKSAADVGAQVDKPIPFFCLSGGFQSVVQKIHKQGAKVFLRNGKLWWQHGIDGKVLSKLYLFSFIVFIKFSGLKRGPRKEVRRNRGLPAGGEPEPLMPCP